MWFILFKYLATAAVVVLVSEVAKRSDQLGALIASLPVMTFLVLLWLYVEQQPSEKIANHAYYTFWYVIPTLPMFILFPLAQQKLGFWGALGASAILTITLFVVWAWCLKHFGIELW